jgi:hypothetical protein
VPSMTCCTFVLDALQIRAQYDGTLWEVIAKEVEEREARKRGDEPRALQAAKDAQVCVCGGGGGGVGW